MSLCASFWRSLSLSPVTTEHNRIEPSETERNFLSHPPKTDFDWLSPAAAREYVRLLEKRPSRSRRKCQPLVCVCVCAGRYWSADSSCGYLFRAGSQQQQNGHRLPLTQFFATSSCLAPLCGRTVHRQKRAHWAQMADWQKECIRSLIAVD